MSLWWARRGFTCRQASNAGITNTPAKRPTARRRNADVTTIRPNGDDADAVGPRLGWRLLFGGAEQRCRLDGGGPRLPGLFARAHNRAGRRHRQRKAAVDVVGLDTHRQARNLYGSQTMARRGKVGAGFQRHVRRKTYPHARGFHSRQSMAPPHDHAPCLAEEQAPSLIITDFKMPGLSGLDLLKVVRKSFPQTSVLMITAFGTRSEERRVG